MLSKIKLLIVLLPLILLISACSWVPTPFNLSSECDEENLEKVLAENFHLTPGSYTVKSSTCHGWRARGTLEIEDKKVTFFYHQHQCTSGGSFCGWDACFAISDNGQEPLLTQVEDVLCDRLKSYKCQDNKCYNKTDSPLSYQEQCHQGGYRVTTDELTAVSIHQVDHSSCATPKLGIADCLSLEIIKTNYPYDNTC